MIYDHKYSAGDFYFLFFAQYHNKSVVYPHENRRFSSKRIFFQFIKINKGKS